MNVYIMLFTFVPYPFSIFQVTYIPVISSISFLNILKMSETNYSIFSLYCNTGISRIFLCVPTNIFNTNGEGNGDKRSGA